MVAVMENAKTTCQEHANVNLDGPDTFVANQFAPNAAVKKLDTVNCLANACAKKDGRANAATSVDLTGNVRIPENASNPISASAIQGRTTNVATGIS